MKLHIYLDRTSGMTIAIQSYRKPKPRSRMHVVYEWSIEKKKYFMAPFPEIPNGVLFSDRFIYLSAIDSSFIY